MTVPVPTNHFFAGTMLTWEQVGPVPMVTVASVAAALRVDEDALIKDYLHSGDAFNILWGNGAGEESFEFDSLWEYLKHDCPFQGAKALYRELFNQSE
jgi:hypothetical protein